MIKFNIQEVLNSLTGILKSAVTQDLPAVEIVVAGYVTSAGPRLTTLASGVASGEISSKELVLKLKDEEINLEAQLLSIGQIIGADLKELATKGLSIIVGALNDAVS